MAPKLPDIYVKTQVAPSGFGYECTESGGGLDCVPAPGACDPDLNVRYTAGGDTIDRSADGVGTDPDTSDDMVTVIRVRVNTIEGTEEILGYDCVTRSEATGEGADAIDITVTQRDFASMPVKPLVPHAGPPDGWLPVNMVNVLYVEPESQELSTELLDIPVAVRATPVSYHWDLGDGNTITTDNPGSPFPSEEVSSTYNYEGWYDITLTTTFAGEFSVNGGPWQPIDGTIEVASDPVEIYSKSLESRLVNGNVPVDEDEDPWIPERTAETEGRQDPEAQHREI